MPCRPAASSHGRRLANAPCRRRARTSGEAGMSLAPSSAARGAARDTTRRAARRSHGAAPRARARGARSAIAAQGGARERHPVPAVIPRAIIIPRLFVCQTRLARGALLAASSWAASGASRLQPPAGQAQERCEAAHHRARARAYGGGSDASRTHSLSPLARGVRGVAQRGVHGSAAASGCTWASSGCRHAAAARCVWRERTGAEGAGRRQAGCQTRLASRRCVRTRPPRTSRRRTRRPLRQHHRASRGGSGVRGGRRRRRSC